jgi:hypothetical protein
LSKLIVRVRRMWMKDLASGSGGSIGGVYGLKIAA